MSALEDSLRAVYKLPQTQTVPMGGLRRQTGAMVTEQEIGEYMRPRTGATFTEDELNRAMAVPGNMEEMPEEPELSAEDQELADRLLQLAQQRSQAPLVELTDTLQAAGTGEDSILAHLTPGEVILSPKFMEDPEFEKAVENKFKEIGEDPERYVAGSGIANLNVETGAPEYGFFKKIGKKLKKVVKKVAPVAMFIPGVGTALGAALGGIGGLAGSALTKVGLGGVASTLGGAASTALGGIAKLGIPGISSIAGGTAGGFGGIANALTTKSGLLGGGMFGETGSSFLGGPEAGKGLANRFGFGSGTAGQVEAYQKAQQAQTLLGNLTPEQRAVMDPAQLQNLENLAAGGKSTGFMSNVSSIFGGGGQQQQLYDAQGNPVQSRGGLANLLGGGGGGGGFGNFAKMAGIGALSAGLGKLAYEDAKKQKGVGLTPLTTMSPTGRYNIEAEIARRMGQQRPNPVEFGLLPEGTLPQLSGGQPRQAALGGAIEELQGGMARGMQDGGEMATKMSGLAMRMKMADDKIDAMVPTRRETGAVVNEKELPPGGMRDTMIQALLPESIEDMFRSERVLDFENAAQQFASALLRQETGAVINDSELDFVMRTYMPKPGDSQSTILEKSRARKMAIQSLMPKQEKKSDGIGSMMPMMNGGPIMAYAQGGAVAMQEGGEMDPGSFPRMDGDINGPGTEQSDDIPAMLSDGEFVMTARAVRGAGSYEMQTEPGGIINLVPSLKEDRERGMDVMYKVMDTFSGQANPS